MDNKGYYDGTKLLSLRDLNGNKPEIYISTSNRGPGKTTYFNRLVINRFLKKKQKFILLYRYSTDLENLSDKFFSDIKGLFFPEYSMISKKDPSKAFYNLWLRKNNGEPMHCGYGIALNAAEKIKQNSHLLSDTRHMIFDEFQTETNTYLSDEVIKFQSIHTSIARGDGEFARYLPVYMIANYSSIINPYYVKMGISDRLRSDTKYLRGDGWVLEQGYYPDAAQALKESGFMRAFGNSSYNKFAAENVYLNDNTAFIGVPKGKGRYLATIAYKDELYAVRAFSSQGIVYCDQNVDHSFPVKLALTTEDHQINYVMLRSSSDLVLNLRWYFEKGCFLFKNLQAKECIMKLVSYY